MIKITNKIVFLIAFFFLSTHITFAANHEDIIDKAKEVVKEADELLNGNSVDSGKGSSKDHPVFDEHPGKGKENKHKGHDIGKGHEKVKGKGHQKHGHDKDDSLLDTLTDEHNDTAKDMYDDHGRVKERFEDSGQYKQKK